MARRRKKPRLPIQVRLDRLEAKHTSGLRLDEDGQPASPAERWLVRAAPVGAVVEASPGRKKTARRRAIREPAADQVAPDCPVFGVCGGCQLQEMPLGRQRAEKERLIASLVGVSDGDGVQAHPIEGAPAAYGYRNKLELSWGARRYVPESALGPDGVKGIDLDGSFLGFHPPGWFGRIVPLEGCPLGTPAMNAAIARVAALGLAPAWNATTHEGLWRHLVLRDLGTADAPDLVVTVVTTTAATPDDLAPVVAALEDLPGLRGVLWVVTDRVSEVAQGELRATLWGRSDLEARLGGATFELPHDAFFQVNTAGAEVLVEVIRRALRAGADGRPGGLLLDLYCGVGALGLALAGDYDDLLGVELHEAAVETARHNAARNGVSGRWVAGPVEAVVPELGLTQATHVVVDPPRAGLHPKAAAFLASFDADVLVYVSCGPKSLGRDRAVLEAGGWRLTDLYGVDLFPQTHHTEAVGRFVRDRPGA